MNKVTICLVVANHFFKLKTNKRLCIINTDLSIENFHGILCCFLVKKFSDCNRFVMYVPISIITCVCPESQRIFTDSRFSLNEDEYDLESFP